MPTAEPTASKSENWCPIINTISLAFIWSEIDAAMTLVRTLSRFSTPLDRPPKKSYASFFFFTATWSPPRPNAISKACLAHCSLSVNVSAPRPIPMDTVALLLPGALIFRMTSKISKRFSNAHATWRSSLTSKYRLPPLSFFTKPTITCAQLFKVASTSALIRASSVALQSCANSSLLSNAAIITQGRVCSYSLLMFL